MLRFPPLPPWEGAHPIIVHFPIALLMVAPAFVVLAMLWKSRAREMLLAATLLVLAGTAFALLATASGGAAEDAAKRVAGAKEVLHEHEELAELARNLFLGVSAVFVVLTLGVWWRREPLAARARVAGGVLLLAAYAFPALTLANAAHEGGRLVHEVGVRAALTPGAPAAPGRKDDD